MISILFYVFSAILLTEISFFAWKHTLPGLKQMIWWFPLTMVLFQLGVFILGEFEFYTNLAMPPRLVYAGILPSFVLLAVFSFSKIGNQLCNYLPLHLPVIFQSFRILVELFIYLIYLLGWGPKEATMIGYNYEFYFGITALIMGYLMWKKKLSGKILLVWNLIGLIMLGFIVGIFFTASIAWDTFWGKEAPMMSNEMMKMPALSIATLYMPLAVWMHIFSIRQLCKQKKMKVV